MDTSSAVDVITTTPEVVDFSLIGLFLAADLVVKKHGHAAPLGHQPASSVDHTY